MAMVAVSGLLSIPPLLGVPDAVEPNFLDSGLIDVSFPVSVLYLFTSFPSNLRLVLPTRVLAFALIAFCALLSLALAFAISWSDRARRAHWPLTGFLTALPVAISWEYFLVPMGTGGGSLAEPYLSFVRLGAALAFAASAVMLLRFAAGFPEDLNTTGQPLVDEATRRKLSSMKGNLSVTVKSPHFAWLRFGEEDVAKQIKSNRRLVAAMGRGRLLPMAAVGVASVRLGNEVLFGVAFYPLIVASLVGTWWLLGVQSHGPDGGRVRWISGGATTAFLAWAVLGTLPFALTPLLGDVGWGLYVALALGIAPFAMLALLIGGLGLAVFYQGAIDPRLAIRKTTVYGALGVLFIVLFAVVESLVSEVLEARLGLPSMLGAALSGAVVALIVIPLRGRFSRWLDRWMPKPEKAAGEVQSSDTA